MPPSMGPWDAIKPSPHLDLVKSLIQVPLDQTCANIIQGEEGRTHQLPQGKWQRLHMAHEKNVSNWLEHIATTFEHCT